MGKTRYIGQIGQLKPEKIAEYDQLHAACWPHIRQLLRDCGIQNYSIFRHDTLVFSYFEYIGADYDADMARMAADETNKAWWRLTDPCFERYACGQSEFCCDMKQIFYNA